MMLAPHSYIGKQIGIFGNDSNLPFNDFTWSPNEVIGVYFEAQENSTIFEQLVRVVSVNPGNRMAAAIYKLTGVDSANEMVKSPDIVDFDNVDSILSFRQNKFIENANDYVLAFQAESACKYFYDGAGSDFYFNIGMFTFGEFPANFSGVFRNANICQYWAKYYF